MNGEEEGEAGRERGMVEVKRGNEWGDVDMGGLAEGRWEGKRHGGVNWGI